MILLTDKENNSYEKQNVCYICKKEFSIYENDKNAFNLYHKVRVIVITPRNLEELLIVFEI